MQIQTYNNYNVKFIQGSHCFNALSVNSLTYAAFTLLLTPSYSIVVVAESVVDLFNSFVPTQASLCIYQ